MGEFKTFFLKGKEFRYYSDTRIEYESHNVKNNWTPIAIYDQDIYKKIKFTFNGKRHSVLLHRIIYFVHNPTWDINDKKQKIDHIIHPIGILSLDNSITNLRCVTQQQNTFNRNNTLGVSWNKQHNKWHARITFNGKLIHLGYFKKKRPQ
jgi:hypothetical protein